jgi:hypothetical protein
VPVPAQFSSYFLLIRFKNAKISEIRLYAKYLFVGLVEEAQTLLKGGELVVAEV